MPMCTHCTQCVKDSSAVPGISIHPQCLGEWLLDVGSIGVMKYPGGGVKFENNIVCLQQMTVKRQIQHFSHRQNNQSKGENFIKLYLNNRKTRNSLSITMKHKLITQHQAEQGWSSGFSLITHKGCLKLKVYNYAVKFN